MKKFLLSLILIFSFTFLNSAAFAVSFMNGTTAEFGEDTIISGEHESTVFAAGNNIKISGKIDGDVFAFGNYLQIEDAEITGNLYAFGNVSTITNIIAKDVFAAGNTTWIKSSKIRDISSAGNDLILDNIEARSLNTSSSGVNISGKFSGNVIAVCEALIIGENTEINAVEYTSENEAAISATAVVSQSITRYDPIQSRSEMVKTAMISLISMLLSLLVAFVFIKFFGNHSEDNLKLSKKDYWLLPAIACLCSIIIPIVLVGLVLSRIGIPLIVALAAFTTILVVFSTFVGIILFANSMAVKMELRNPINNFLYVLYTFFVIFLLSLLRSIGWIFVGYSFFVGFGWIIKNIFSKKGSV